MMTLKTLQNEQ